MSDFMEHVAERAKLREMNPLEFLRWRNTLRQDYQQAFDPPPYQARTSLGFGWPMGLERGDTVNVGTHSREFYEAREAARLAKVQP